MNEELNLVEILKNTPNGTKLWSDVHGEITFVKIQDSIGSEILCISKISNCSFSSKGEFYAGLGQCILFPSKTQRDWSKFKVDLPGGTKVMCSDNGNDWMLRIYRANKYANVPTIANYYAFKYVIQVSDFDFGNIESNINKTI